MRKAILGDPKGSYGKVVSKTWAVYKMANWQNDMAPKFSCVSKREERMGHSNLCDPVTKTKKKCFVFSKSKLLKKLSSMEQRV